MSVRVMSQVWALDLPDSQKIVLLALADSANDEGHCWPSMRSLVAKCSKSERTIQGVIKELVEAGHLTRTEVVGKGCNYMVHPRSGCAPQTMRPAANDTPPPQLLRPTPAAAADKPSKNHKEPSTLQRARKAPIPDDWIPRQFGERTESRKVVDSWPPGEEAAQLEQFKANHRAKGNTFIDPQDAWSTWVLNSRKFGHGGKFRGSGATSPDKRSGLARAIDSQLGSLRAFP